METSALFEGVQATRFALGGWFEAFHFDLKWPSPTFQRLQTERLFPNQETQDKLLAVGSTVLLKPNTFEEILRRPEISCSTLERLGFDFIDDPLISEPVEIEVKYSGYIKRQLELIEQSKRLEEYLLPFDLDYLLVRGLSNEEVQKLNQVRPRTLGQAQRISGVNPSAVQAIIIFLKGHRKLKELSLDGRTGERDSSLAN